MKKTLSAALLVAAVTFGAAQFAYASPTAPVAGKDYTVLNPAHSVSAPAGKVEVTEFMWYGCPHCSEFDPYLQKWKAKQGANIVFRRVPVAFSGQFVPHSKMLLALDVLGLNDKLTPVIFNEIHVKRNYLLTPEAQADFLAKQGVDRKKYLDAYHSFTVASELKRISQMAQDYKIDGVPTVIVQGKYETGPATTDSLEGTIQVLDYLVAQVAAKKM